MIEKNNHSDMEEQFKQTQPMCTWIQDAPSDSWHTVPRRKTGAPVLRYGPDSTATGVVATLPG